MFYDCNHVKRFWLDIKQWLTGECDIDLKFSAKNVLFGVVEKDNCINSVICYARLLQNANNSRAGNFRVIRVFKENAKYTSTRKMGFELRV